MNIHIHIFFHNDFPLSNSSFSLYTYTEKVTKSCTLYAKWTEQKQENGGSEDVVNNNSGNENKESSNTIVLTIDEHDALVYGTTKTNDVAGDGTTTATVLAQAMVQEGMKNLEAGANPIILRKGMKKATDAAVEAIANMSRQVTGKDQIAKVAAISAGGAGAVFWMWVTALIGSSTAFVEATLAQIHKEKDPLYGGYRGGPAYYIHHYMEEKTGKKKNHTLIAVLFAISGLICWCGISQVISNSVASSFENAFHIPPLYTTIVLVAVAAVIVLRKNATVKVLDLIVPIMAVCYFFITIFVILINMKSIPSVFGRIFEEAFGIRQVVSGGFGAVLMNGVKRGLFSNEAGSGSAPCAAAAAECDFPVKAGLTQALGVFIDTIVICSCTAMIMLLAPENVVAGKSGMDLLQSAMKYHLGEFGVIFIALTLFLFSFSTFLGILFYARSNVSYLFGDKWFWQTAYKVLALVMLFIGGIAAYTFVWDLGDVGIGLMTIFNTGILYLMGGQALKALKEYESNKEKK